MANEQWLIDANVLMEHLDSCINESKGLVKSLCVAIKCFVEQMPTVDAVEVVHGRWERDEWGSFLRRCSVCKKYPVYKNERGIGVAVYADVCINCGAKMDGGAEHAC